MFLKFDMNLEDVNSLYKFFGYFRDSMKFVSFYIDLNKHVLRPRERERERQREYWDLPDLICTSLCLSKKPREFSWPSGSSWPLRPHTYHSKFV